MSEERSLVYFPDDRLRTKCLDIDKVDSDDVAMLINAMTSIMIENSGIGIAAPQVGSLKRVFVMADIVSMPENEEDLKENKEDFQRSMYANCLVFANPKILSRSDETSKYQEGCLSFPGITFDVERPKEVKVSYVNAEGFTKEETFRGLAAVCVQHEIDHLDGKLFIDYIGSVRRSMIAQKMKKLKRNRLK